MARTEIHVVILAGMCHGEEKRDACDTCMRKLHALAMLDDLIDAAICASDMMCGCGSGEDDDAGCPLCELSTVVELLEVA